MRPNQAKRVLEDLEYPVTTAELVDAVGDTEIDLPLGTETIADVFGRVGSETYAEPSDAYAMFQSGLSNKAIGRKGYTDRDPPAQPTIPTLLADDARLDAEEPHCGICQHVELVGDWTVVGYCDRHDTVVEPELGDVCGEFETVVKT